MNDSRAQRRSVALAMVFSAVGGGLFVAVATRAIPKMISRIMGDMMRTMMTQMGAQMGAEGCNPAEM